VETSQRSAPRRITVPRRLIQPPRRPIRHKGIIGRRGRLGQRAFPAKLAEVASAAEVGDGRAYVVEGAVREATWGGPLSLGFAAVAHAVLAGSSSISVVAVVQQVL
jgi:hypothetical protein